VGAHAGDGSNDADQQCDDVAGGEVSSEASGHVVKLGRIEKRTRSAGAARDRAMFVDSGERLPPLLRSQRAVGDQTFETEEHAVSNFDGPQHVRQETYVEPVPAPPVVAQPAVTVQPVVTEGVVAQQVVAPAQGVRTASVRRFAPDAIIAAIVGLVLLVMGLLAVVRGGFDGSMEDPVVEVLGFTHTTTLGLIEIVLGACLLIAGASSWRGGAIFFGAVLAIGGFVGAVQTESFVESLALESSFAWLAVIAGTVVVLSALLLPRYLTRTSVTQTTGVQAY
jgi:hypothetical protein